MILAAISILSFSGVLYLANRELMTRRPIGLTYHFPSTFKGIYFITPNGNQRITRDASEMSIRFNESGVAMLSPDDFELVSDWASVSAFSGGRLLPYAHEPSDLVGANIYIFEKGFRGSGEERDGFLYGFVGDREQFEQLRELIYGSEDGLSKELKGRMHR